VRAGGYEEEHGDDEIMFWGTIRALGGQFRRIGRGVTCAVAGEARLQDNVMDWGTVQRGCELSR
jgi:hypothetical protein